MECIRELVSLVHSSPIPKPKNIDFHIILEIDMYMPTLLNKKTLTLADTPK